MVSGLRPAPVRLPPGHEVKLPYLLEEDMMGEIVNITMNMNPPEPRLMAIPCTVCKGRRPSGFLHEFCRGCGNTQVQFIPVEG